MRIEDLITELQKRYQPETEVVAVFWHKEDIVWRAEDRAIVVSDEEAGQIIEALEANHDASIGINWEVIDFHLDNLKHDQSL